MLIVNVGQIVTNVVVQIIILLYLIDNNEQTSWMILMGSGMGVLVEAWKVRASHAWISYGTHRHSHIDHKSCRHQNCACFRRLAPLQD